MAQKEREPDVPLTHNTTVEKLVLPPEYESSVTSSEIRERVMFSLPPPPPLLQQLLSLPPSQQYRPEW